MSELNLELPRNKSGSTDYEVLGKIITAKLMGEVVCASHVDKRHGNEKTLPSFKADTEWEVSRESNKVVVLRKKMQRTCFMGRGVIDAPLKVVADFLKDITSSFTWDDMLVEARYEKVFKETENETDYLGYQLFETNRYCGIMRVKRDLLYYTRCAFIEGKYVHSAVSIEDPNYPVIPGIPRMFIHMGSGFVAESYKHEPKKTLLSYLAHIDTNGIPSVINNYVLNKHPIAVAKIRTSLEQRAAGPHLASEAAAATTVSMSYSVRPCQNSSRHFEDATSTRDFVKGFHGTT